MHLKSTLTACIALVALATQAAAVEWRPLNEVKTFVLERAGHRGAFASVKKEDVEGILKNINSLDRDEWAREWCKVGLKYEAQGDERAKSGASSQELAEIYQLAFNYCMLGRYPTASSPGKKEAYQHSVRQYRKAGPHLDPPLQVIEIPFEGKKLVGYLRVP